MSILASLVAPILAMHLAPPQPAPFVEEELANSLKSEESNVTSDQFNTILQAARDAFADEAQHHRERLVIGGFWDNDTVNGYTKRGFGNVIITVYGGIARRPEVTPDGFALVLCHELAHAYGGRPHKPLQFSISVEGQSDYFGAGECMRQLLPRFHFEGWETPSSPWVETTCQARFASSAAQSLCVRQLNAASSAGHLLAWIKKTEAPSFETPDTTEVRSTLNNYPETIQCRLDSFRAGVLGEPRPRCWFAP